MNRILATLLSACFMVSWTSHCCAEITTVIGWDNQIFPSYVLATNGMVSDSRNDPSVLGDRLGQIGVVVKATKKNQLVTVRVQCEEFFEESEITVELPLRGDTYVIYPRVRYHFDRLSQNWQARPTTVTFQVDNEEWGVVEMTKNATIRSINDCPLMYVDGEEMFDTTFTFAAYVNEQHPFIDKMLRESLDRGLIDRFTGYQSGDHRIVMRQVYAIWDLLVARDVRYSDITATVVNSKGVVGQHVRMIEESINNSQANCVDGSVLLVSMLRKIGIEAHLVLEPRHCYVCFELDQKGEVLIGLETTMIDRVYDEPKMLDALLEGSIPEELRDVQSWPSFANAMEHATRKLDAAGKQKMEARRKGKEDPSHTTIVNITAARSRGILPIPFEGREEFVAFDHSEESMTEASPSDMVAKENEDDEDYEGEDYEGEDEEALDPTR